MHIGSVEFSSLFNKTQQVLNMNGKPHQSAAATEALTFVAALRFYFV